MNTKKGLLYLSLFLFLACLACSSDDERSALVGKWIKHAKSDTPGTMEFKDNSFFYFTAASEEHADSQGRYSVTENKITFEDDTCSDPGSYEYLIDNKTLSLTTVRDHCEVRGLVLRGNWTRDE